MDQSVVEAFFDQNETVKSLGQEAGNWMKLLGALVAHRLIFSWFGIAAFLIPPLLFLFGYKVIWGKALVKLSRAISFSLFFLIWVSLLMGSMIKGDESISEWSFYSGGLGYQLSIFFDNLLGYGTILFLAFTLLVFVIFFFNITEILSFKKTPAVTDPEDDTPFLASDLDEEFPVNQEVEDNEPVENIDSETELKDWVVSLKEEKEEKEAEMAQEALAAIEEPQEEVPEPIDQAKESADTALELEVTPVNKPIPKALDAEPTFEVEINEKAEKLVEIAGHYDPTLDLPKYQFPRVDMLREYSTGKISVTKEELQANKDKIVETLTNFKIGISSIKATIGPTVTLYEIVPEAGVKISKIKNLEDDIALSLAALGIRIIAPIPGKGTIGIEVPNKNKEMVSMKSVISTEKFMNSDMALPIGFGKTISNEVFVADLAKMPHLLMAGATGQGKSVGLNVILASLLYKKHPSQLKFVLVDPKKVELTLFNKIERHYLAKLPDNEEPIITDTKKVINTLNSLCIEMDQRYDLLKDAACRNIKEYNQKFVDRKLNPEKGHKFLPYIVLGDR